MSVQALVDLIDTTSEAADLVEQAVRKVEQAQRACTTGGHGHQWMALVGVKAVLKGQATVLGEVIMTASNRLEVA